MNVQSFSRFPRLAAGQFEVVEAQQKIGQADSRLDPRERRAQAGMDSVTEADVRIRVTGNIEFFAALEMSFVSIGGSDHRQHQTPG